jgi:hypothetical protein
MNCFYKLNFKLENIDTLRIKGNLTEKYGPANTKLSHYSIKDFDYFLSLHKNKIKFNIMPAVVWYTEIIGTEEIPPHIDPIDTVALNYYIETANCTTSFYTPLPTAEYKTTGQEFDGGTQTDEYTVRAVYDLNNLKFESTFTAQPHEAYLLRPDILHSVSNPNSNRRSFISYRWCTGDFNQILNSIEILSLL